MSCLDFYREHTPHNHADWCHFKFMSTYFKLPPSTARKCYSTSYKFPFPLSKVAIPHLLLSILPLVSLPVFVLSSQSPPDVAKKTEATIKGFLVSPPWSPWCPWTRLSLQACAGDRMTTYPAFPETGGSQDMELPILKLSETLQREHGSVNPLISNV